MKSQLTSVLRHIVTFIAGLGTLLASYYIIAPESAASVNQAGAALVDPLCVLLGAIAAGFVRLVMAWIASKKFPPTGGNMVQAWAVWLGLAGLMGFGLPACSAGDPQIPIRASYHQNGITVGYSSKGGLAVEVDQRGKN